jgi:hypothetical protein
LIGNKNAWMMTYFCSTILKQGPHRPRYANEFGFPISSNFCANSFEILCFECLIWLIWPLWRCFNGGRRRLCRALRAAEGAEGAQRGHHRCDLKWNCCCRVGFVVLMKIFAGLAGGTAVGWLAVQRSTNCWSSLHAHMPTTSSTHTFIAYAPVVPPSIYVPYFLLPWHTQCL